MTAAGLMSSPVAVAGPRRAWRRCGPAARASASAPTGPGNFEARATSSGAGAASGGAASPCGSGGPLELKGGALWWQNLHTSAITPLYGDNFVLQRPTIGGPGLVRAVRQPPPVQHRRPAAAPPAVWAAPGCTELTLACSSLGSGSLVIDTECEEVPPAIAPNTTCTGLVWRPAADAEGKGGAETAAGRTGRSRATGKHPRRTQQLRFTCNLCGEVNDAAVNPHAWRAGSVFARCQGCTAVHKLRDNLNIFHELAGPVFPPPELRANYLVQEILDRIQQRNGNGGGGDYNVN